MMEEIKSPDFGKDISTMKGPASMKRSNGGNPTQAGKNDEMTEKVYKEEI